MIELRRKYIHNTRKEEEVYVTGRAELLPEKVAVIVFVTLKDGSAKAAREDIFLKAYSLAE